MLMNHASLAIHDHIEMKSCKERLYFRQNLVLETVQANLGNCIGSFSKFSTGLAL